MSERQPRLMPAFAAVIWLFHSIGSGSALSTIRQQDIADSQSEGVPSEDLFAWRPGSEEDTDSGPEQVAGAELSARSLAVERKPAKKATAPVKKRKRWPAHLQARLLLPEAKLAFCYMPKVASAQMSSMFGELNGVDEDFSDPWEASGPKNMNISWHNVTQENGWKFAYFTRDPLARYLSAFGSKCIVNSDGAVEGNGKDCLGKILWHSTPMESMVTMFEERAKNDSIRGRPANNSHWFPMIKCLRACGIDRFNPQKVDFIGNLDSDAHDEVTRMFQKTGVMSAYPQAAEIVEKYFPKQSLSGHSSKSHNKQDLFYRNHSTVWYVSKLYGEDYTRLNLRKPSVWEQAVEASRYDRFHDEELLTKEDIASIEALEAADRNGLKRKGWTSNDKSSAARTGTATLLWALRLLVCAAVGVVTLAV